MRWQSLAQLFPRRTDTAVSGKTWQRYGRTTLPHGCMILFRVRFTSQVTSFICLEPLFNSNDSGSVKLCAVCIFASCLYRDGLKTSPRSFTDFDADPHNIGRRRSPRQARVLAIRRPAAPESPGVCIAKADSTSPFVRVRRPNVRHLSPQSRLIRSRSTPDLVSHNLRHFPPGCTGGMRSGGFPRPPTAIDPSSEC